MQKEAQQVEKQLTHLLLHLTLQHHLLLMLRASRKERATHQMAQSMLPEAMVTTLMMVRVMHQTARGHAMVPSRGAWVWVWEWAWV